MELIVGGLIVTQVVGSYLTYKYHRSLLNAVMAKSTQEYIQLERQPKRKVRRPDAVQDDAGIPFGL